MMIIEEGTIASTQWDMVDCDRPHMKTCQVVGWVVASLAECVTYFFSLEESIALFYVFANSQ